MQVKLILETIALTAMIVLFSAFVVERLQNKRNGSDGRR